MLKSPRRSGCPGVVSIDVLMVGHRVLIRTVTIGHDQCGQSMLMMRRAMRPMMMTVVMMVTVVVAVLMRELVTALVAVHDPVRRSGGDPDHLPTPQAAAELREDHEHEQGQPHHDWPSIGSAADRPTRHAP